MSEKPVLEGRVAIVTGGACGIGAAISERLIAEGASVVVADSGVDIAGNDADPSVAEQFADRLGDRAIAYTEDMGVPVAATQAVERAVEAFGGIDIIVNNAAILRDSFLFRGSPDNWDVVIRNNLSGPYYLLAAATPVMREQAKAGRGDGDVYGWGRIVNMVSTAGFVGNYGQSPYAAAKGGLISLTRIAALDMARTGVTANAVAPFARTRVTDSIQPANDEQAAYKERALKVSPDHVGTFVAWLCSDGASDVTGQLFGVRGREAMIFSQSRPVASIVSKDGPWSIDNLRAAVKAEFSEHFVDLRTDLELFNTDPEV